jgi:hypothetical protein
MERIVNAVTALIADELYEAGAEGIRRLPTVIAHDSLHPNMDLWTSVYSGIAVISNRKTLKHWDSGGCAEWYDLLISAGTCSAAELTLPDIQARLSYPPGCMVAVCGKLLGHAVLDWSGGERLCYAHYMRNMVHDRVDVHKPGWVKSSQYTSMMDKGYVLRHSL